MIETKDTSQPLMVTIRCCTYNQERYIRDCLEGFVMQKASFRFEAIVHDDASTDGTAAIIKEYAEKYPDIIKPIFETENQYSKHDGSLRRIMDEHTHGKYVAYCEGDDYWIDPLKLQKQVDFLEEHPDYSMCWTDAYQETDGKKLPYHRYTRDCQSPMEDIIEKGGLWIPTASTLYRKSVLQSFPINLICFDYTMQVWSGIQGKSFYFAKQTCIYRYMSAGSWTSKTAKANSKQVKRRLEQEKDINEKLNSLSASKYNTSFERWAAQLLFDLALAAKDYNTAQKYLKLRDKYNINTPKVIRLEVNKHHLLAFLYRMYAKYKIALCSYCD